MNYRRRAATVGLVGAGAFALLELAQTVLRSDHPFTAPMSEYALGKYGFLQTVAFAALGLGSLALAAALASPGSQTPGWTAGRLLLATWSVGVLLAAAFPVDAGNTTAAGHVHAAASALSFAAVVAAMLVLGAAFAEVASSSFSRTSAKLAWTAAGALLVGGATPGTVMFGLAQRLFVGAVVAWLMLTAIRLRAGGRDRGSDLHNLERALSELDRGNLDELRSLLHPKVRWDPVPNRGLDPCRNRDQVLATMRHHLENGFRLEDVELHRSGADVVVAFRAPPHIALPAGARFSNVVRFRAGKVVHIQDYVEWEKMASRVADAPG